MSTFKLPRTHQCKKCPWKVDTNPHEIPDGYCEVKHAGLRRTIADGLNIGQPQRVMACHHSTGDDEMYCIGWLANQIGPGNNIALRIRMLSCENIRDLTLVGEQHEQFEDTLPETKTH